jgi:ribonuclease Z
MKLILLGSGAVRIDLDRWGPAQVVQVNDESLLFDCGRGATMRLAQANIPLPSIRKVFFTHLHYDHNCDFPYFFLTSWVMGRDFPLEITGPRGTQAFCDGLFKQAYREDIESRRGHLKFSSAGDQYSVREILEEEFTLQGKGYTIRMVHVKHRPPLDNLAFRIESAGKSVVVVGDTTQCEPLMNLAKNADVLVHECSFPAEVLKKEDWRYRTRAHGQGG